MPYVVSFITYTNIEVEAENEDEAITKAEDQAREVNRLFDYDDVEVWTN